MTEGKKQKEQYVGGKEATRILGIHQRTLYQWDKKGWIETMRTPGGKRLYNVNKYLEENVENNSKNNIEKINICYARVSSKNQEDDLKRQIKELKRNYPTYIVIEDIGSGLNLNKKGIRKIIKYAIEGKINELVVTYKDRLTRFGYELIEELISKYSNGKITIINKKENIEPQEELIMDVMSILNVYVAKMNGLRKYNKNKVIKKEDKFL